MKKTLLTFSLLALLFAACTEEESNIGLGLQDPATYYNGIADTLYGSAVTVFDDSLMTTGYSQGMIGHYSDATFGSVHASLFTQIANTTENSVNWGSSTIDSAILQIAITEVYPDTYTDDEPISFRMEIRQLADKIATDSSYYSTDSVPVSSTKFFDGNVSITKKDTVLRISLNSTFRQMLQGNSYSNNELKDAVKGFYIHTTGAPVLLTLNFNAASSSLTIYHTFHGDVEDAHLEDMLSIGAGATHFNRFMHNYTGSLSVFNSNKNDSVADNGYLYLDPMGGTRVKYNFDADIKAFKAAHPNAIIHFAELMLPVATEKADDNPPSELVAMKKSATGAIGYIADMTDGYTSSTLNYRFDTINNRYHLRITEHMQQLLRQGSDYGTLVLINSRRASAKRTVLRGCATTLSEPTRVVIVYTEMN